MQATEAISIDGVTSRYGRQVALDGMSFSAGLGVCALLGPNGAGKTTMMSAIMGLKQFDGSICVNGEPVQTATFRSSQRAGNVGYLPQRFGLASRLRVGETVAYAAWCNGRSRKRATVLATRALERVGLTEKHHDRVKTLSGGQRQRLGIACAMAHAPTVLLLDEPTVGLDPTQRTRLRTYLRDISTETSVIIATHLLEDVQIVADQVVVIDRGSVVFQGSTEEMAKLGQDDHEENESYLECAYRLLISTSDNE